MAEKTDTPAESVDLALPGLVGATRIAEGPFTVVYRATQPAFGRPVAVTVITADLDDEARARFEEECRSAGTLSEHPGIVSLHDAGIGDDGRPYLVMSFLPDGSLADLLERRGAFGWEEAVRIGLHLTNALAAAHRSGVIHGDLRPGTVMMAADGTPLLAEFGVARVVGHQAVRAARTSRSVVGTAPEVIDGAAPSVAADIYSIGAIAHELITGQPPYTVDQSDSLENVIRRVTSEPPIDLRATDTPDDVAALVARTMSRNPADRPVSAATLGRDLHDLCRAHLLDLTDGRRWPEAAPTRVDEPPTAPAPVLVAETAAPAAPAAPYVPTHRVPWTGMPAWSSSDPGPQPVANLDPDLDVAVLEWSGDWARVRCSNDWEAWVDGRQLVPVWQ